MRHACGMLVLALLAGFPASAQFSGRVTGSVVDASGAVIAGANVELYLAGGRKPLLTGKTSSDGGYHFIGVRPAYYDLSVDARGFVRTTLRGVAVDPARETTVARIKLELASVTQTVEVSAEVQGVNISNAEVSNTISAEQVKNLPLLDRDVLGLIQTQPGVVSSGNSYTVIN